ncbi:MAG: hypothetical protein ABIH76_00305 [Candidatus Bathyarchaeota archaeon]
MPTYAIFRYTNPEVSPRQSAEEFLDHARNFIRQCIKTEDRVQVMLSGGVDSAVTAALLHLEVGDRLYATHINTGFMRLIKKEEESKLVAKKFSVFKNFNIVNGESLFYERVMGISDAEQKRLEFRRTYETIVDRVMAESNCNVLAQGTILTDITETEKRIKSQHNVSLEFKNVKKIVEPIAGLYKDEVRKLAIHLTHGFNPFSIPREIDVLKYVYRRPVFPGPGLSIRAVGKITLEKINIVRKADSIFNRRVDDWTRSMYSEAVPFSPTQFIEWETGEQVPFQSFAATFDDKLTEAPQEVKDLVEKKVNGKISCNVLDVNVTGIKSESRTYSRPICIESDFKLDYDVLQPLGVEIPSKTEFPRVLYKVSTKVGSLKYLVAVRSVNSIDGVTADVNPIPMKVVRKVADEIVKECKVTGVYCDITPKPPATIEYE